MKNVGLHSHRLRPGAGNPREVAFAKAWHRECDGDRLLGRLLSEDPRHDIEPSDRDRQVAATVIQWLGSTVGMAFLSGIIKNNKEVREWLESDHGPLRWDEE